MGAPGGSTLGALAARREALMKQRKALTGGADRGAPQAPTAPTRTRLHLPKPPLRLLLRRLAMTGQLGHSRRRSSWTLPARALKGRWLHPAPRRSAMNHSVPQRRTH